MNKKKYACFLLASFSQGNNRNTQITTILILANSEYEAEGMAMRVCKHRCRPIDGWVDHYVQVCCADAMPFDNIEELLNQMKPMKPDEYGKSPVREKYDIPPQEMM